MIKKIPHLLIGVFVLILISLPFIIKVRIECRSQSGGCPEELNSKLKSIDGKNLVSARKRSVNILKNDFLVAEFSRQFKLPDILLINTIIKKPVFSVLDKTSGKYYLLDQDGTVLTETDSSSLPVLTKDADQLKIGQKAPAEDLFALKLIRGVAQMYQVNTGTVQNDSLVVDLAHGIRVLFPLRDADIEVLLGSLRLIYSKITTDSSGMYSQIDMRYKNPLLR